MPTRGHGTRRGKGRSWLATCDLSYLELVYFEYDVFVLLDPCGVNLDDLNISLHGFIPLICKFGQNLAADKIWGRVLGLLLRRGPGQGEDIRQVMSQRDNLGHNLTSTVGDARRASPGHRPKASACVRARSTGLADGVWRSSGVTQSDRGVQRDTSLAQI
jgi:hypothetical protein